MTGLDSIVWVREILFLTSPLYHQVPQHHNHHHHGGQLSPASGKRRQPARWMAPLSLVIDLVNGVESQRFCPFYFIGFSMGKCQIYRLQPWERTLTCIYIYVCLFAGLDMASGLTYKCMFVCMFGLGFRPYKTLQDTEWLQLPQSWGSQNKT